MSQPLRVAFVHPDLGIGGAERLIVDAALGLQALGHSVDIYTSHHNPDHCFEETRDGSLQVHHIKPPFPRSVNGKFHILFAHARQLHLTGYLLRPSAPWYDVYFVDQLSTCVPFLRAFGKTRVLFYCHFPDKLLANGEFVEGGVLEQRRGLLRSIYRYPMDLLEEATTQQADVILANSKFTARVFNSYFSSIRRTPKVVYPGINVSAYETPADASNSDIIQVSSGRPTLLSLNRFEKKKNAALAISAFGILREKIAHRKDLKDLRLMIAGGYDPRLEDNMMTLVSLIDCAKSCSLTYNVITPPTSKTNIPPFNSTSIDPDIVFLLNFTTSQRSALLTASSTLALLYTPTNEHFGIGPVEGMLCGLPIVACNSGGPTESIVHDPPEARTGWLCPPDPGLWTDALLEILRLEAGERKALSERASARARELFGMEAMAKGIEAALRDAVVMGSVGSWSTGWMVLLGFLIAYLLGPLVLPPPV